MWQDHVCFIMYSYVFSVRVINRHSVKSKKEVTFSRLSLVKSEMQINLVTHKVSGKLGCLLSNSIVETIDLGQKESPQKEVELNI